jgi:capsular exopolysaccharide synthesis family protein
MSTNESLTQPDEIPSEQAITIQPSGIAAYPGSGDWMPAVGADPVPDGEGGLAMLHALRRHWLVILSTGLACAAVTGILLYSFLKPQYQAMALLEFAPSNPTILGKQTADQAQVIANEFEIFRDTQQSLIKSRFVIMAALRDPKLKNRACILREDAKHNTVEWLTDEVRVDPALKNAGLMQVSTTQPDPEDAAAIVNAVVDAYWNEVVNADRQQRRDRLSELQQISAEKENEVRTKREQLKRELENIGAGDEQTMAVRTQLASSMYAEFQRQFQGMRAEHRMLLGKLQEAKRALADLPGAEIPETEVVVLLNNNPMYRDLQTRLGFLRQAKMAHGIALAPGTRETPTFARTNAEFESTTAQLEKLDSDTRDQVRGAKRIALEQEIHRLESHVEVSTGQLAGFEKEVERRGNEAESMGRSSVAAQMARAEVDNIEHILRSVAEERERLRVELNSATRVTVRGDKNAPASVPEHETRGFRYLFIFAGSLLAMFIPGVGIVMWDLRKTRINSASDLSKRLKIPVMGTVPLIPVMVMRRLGDTTQRSQIWKMRFTESVDGVAARLLRKAARDQTRVVLITSALGGEGKTTLATQLAMSLGRAQRKTVLVDFDLRRPTLGGALGLSPGPGICEALRGEGDIMDMVQQTETECLSVATAGSWNRQVLVALSNGTVGTVLEQLRMNFDFVIIDSSPLLPIVDTRLVSQYVDTVVLSVFRDVSQGSKVLAAQEMLDAFGVRSVEAVLTGGEEHGNAKNLAYQAARFDEEVMPPENEAELIEDGNSPEENSQS